jgi:hypothetical protein
VCEANGVPSASLEKNSNSRKNETRRGLLRAREKSQATVVRETKSKAEKNLEARSKLGLDGLGVHES